MTVTAADIVGIELGSRDPSRLAAFYREAFGFVELPGTPHADDIVRLGLGDFELRLRAISGVGRGIPADSRSNDRWFRHLAIVVDDIDAAWSSLDRHALTSVSATAQRLIHVDPAARGIEARYFRDPEGHPLELIRFPAGKGRKPWHARESARIGHFLGIDHSAIVVADTLASIDFYRRYGLTPSAAGIVNRGEEQEKLSGVEGAKVRITALAGSTGIGLELLEYLAPRNGRLAAPDTSPDDAWFARTLIACAADELATNAVDPDGHGVRLA